MTVKELKAKLAGIPDTAEVEMVVCNTDNPLEESYRVGSIVFLKTLEKDGKEAIVMYPV